MSTPQDPYSPPDTAPPETALPDTALPETALPDTALPDTALPDTAMDTGSDAGEPGGHLGPGDLEPEEERLLAALERDADPRPSAGPETYAAVRAAEDEGPLPAQGGPQDDGLTPRFSSPGEA